MPRHFWRTAVVFLRYRPPLSVKIKGSSSPKLRPPSEFVLPSPARRVTTPSAFPWGFCPTRGSSLWSPLLGGRPGLPTFRPQCFAHSRRLPPPQTLQAYFIPLPRPGFHFRGFPPSNQPVRLIAVPSPPAVGAKSLLMLPPAPVLTASTSGSLSDSRSAITKEGLAPLTIRIPSCVLLLRALLRKPWRWG